VTFDAPKFDFDVKKFTDKLHVDYRKGLRKIALDIFTGIVELMPVDTGRARGSWTVDIYAPDPEVLPPLPEGAPPYKKPSFNLSPSNLDVQIVPPIYISNNLDYILALEEGHSKQGEGMVRHTLQEIQDEILAIMEAA